MAELADALDLGSSVSGREGSTPSGATIGIGPSRRGCVTVNHDVAGSNPAMPAKQRRMMSVQAIKLARKIEINLHLKKLVFQNGVFAQPKE